MKYYIRQIKSYIQPHAIQGCNCDQDPVEGCDWVFKGLEEVEKIIENLQWALNSCKSLE